MKTKRFVLPDLKDLQGVIGDYLDTVAPTNQVIDERDQIIANCINPFFLMVSALEIVNTWGPIEESIWDAFMQDMTAQNQKNKLAAMVRH